MPKIFNQKFLKFSIISPSSIPSYSQPHIALDDLHDLGVDDYQLFDFVVVVCLYVLILDYFTGSK